MKPKQIQTTDGIEFEVKSWTCPDCTKVQTDSVHPDFGPFVSCTCGHCGKAFDDAALDADSRAAWDAARDAADAFRDNQQGIAR